MDVLVEHTVMQASVEPVVPCILQNEENGQVQCDFSPRGEWNIEGHSDFHGNRVEEPNWESFHHEVGDQHRLKTLPLFLVVRELGVLDLVLVEVRDSLDNGPRQTSAKVHDLVHQKEEQSGSKHVVVHVIVVGTPKLLQGVQA